MFKNLWRRHGKLITGSVLLLTVVIISVIGYKSCNSEKEISYEYSKVMIGDINKTITVSGRLDIQNPFFLKSNVSGIVKDVRADFNTQVTRGQVMVVVDPTAIEESIRNQIQSIDNMKADIELVQLDLEAKKNLIKDNLISKQELDRVELNYKKLMVALSQLNTALVNLQLQKKNTVITTPSSGIVINRMVNPETAIGVGTVLFMIATDLTKMQLLINIDESDVGQVRQGQSVDFTVSAYPGKHFGGKISQVRMNPVQQGGIVTYESLALCDNKEELLRPGMTVTANVLVGTRNGVKIVPNQALLVSPVDIEITDDKQYVWIKKSNGNLPVKRVSVTTGLTGDSYTEVISSEIKEGDEVLVGITKKSKSGKLSGYGK